MSLGSDFVPAVSENEPSRRDHLLRIVQIANGVVAAVVNAAIARNEVPVYLALTQALSRCRGGLSITDQARRRRMFLFIRKMAPACIAPEDLPCRSLQSTELM